ncbi:MAG TPA: hypothetical protein VFC31_01380 [Candidatus Limnocylindria bacterium]|nr:hypothetical protein [Candidatus Limnocylindria bacterium]
MKTLRLREGILGGVVAGVVMAMVAMTYTLIAQGDLLAPVKQMGALLFAADSGSPLSLIAGLMLHMMSAAVFGAVFVLLARAAIDNDWVLTAAGFWPLAVAAMSYIVIEWAVAAFVILPAIDRPLLTTFASIGGFVAHAMYGLVLAWWLVWRAAPVAVRVRTGNHQHNVA